MNMFSKLVSRSGGFSKPFLISLRDESEENLILNFVNNSEDIQHNGVVYKAAGFKYIPNISNYGFDGGGSLEISAKETNAIELVETYQNVKLEVIDVVNENGVITELKDFSHHYGTVTVDRNKINFSFNSDDRTEMTFPTLIWSTQNNSGNS